MSDIKTAGDLRGFLAGVLEGIRDGSVDPHKAAAISKVSAEINKSLAIEVSAALQLRRMGEESLADVSLSIGEDNQPAFLAHRVEQWCDQCEKLVCATKAKSCAQKFCKAKDLF
jgi:hypothetical protein